MSKLDKDQVLSDFTEAYKAANGKEPSIEAKGGWYSIDGGKNVRLAAVEEMTSALKGGDAPATKPAAKEDKPAKAAAKKTAAKKAPAKTAKVSSTGYTVVKKGDGYNPANYWLDYLSTLGSDSRTPQGFY
jgi:hypothetical protein